MKTLNVSQIAGSNYHYIKYSLPYFLDSMARLDQHLIEFYAASPHLSIEDATYAQVCDLKRELDAREIRVCCLTQERASTLSTSPVRTTPFGSAVSRPL